MSSGSKSTVIGYWYRLLYHFGICKGPVDAYLEQRVGDRVAWKGVQTSSGQVVVNQPNLFGGEKSEGGLSGAMDVMMGEANQGPNNFLSAQLGADQPTYRGKLTTVWRGGRWGAMNPYPKPTAFKVRRILKGWDNDECWYPEKAPIGLISPDPLALYFALDLSGSMSAVTANGNTRLVNMKAAMTDALAFIGEVVLPTGIGLDIMIVGWGGQAGSLLDRETITRRGVTETTLAHLIDWVQARSAIYGITHFPSAVADAGSFFDGSATNYLRLALFITDGVPTIGAGGTEAEAEAAATSAGQTLLSIAGVRSYGINIDLSDTSQTSKMDNTPQDGVPVIGGDDPEALTNAIVEALGGLIAMNPIHILYDSITAEDMQGDPVGMINDASFRAAADRIYSEAFGLCMAYDGGEIEEFQQRVCDVIGACLTQSRIDGQYYVDLIRGDYNLADLPIIGADDILEFSQEPSVLTEQINQVIVKWFDPQAKEERSTAPVQALGAIQAARRVNSVTRDYPELAAEFLSLRVAGRDLQASSTPVSRFRLTINRRWFDLRPGLQFRLQYPAEGIADMVCLLGDVDYGTLTDGRIRIIAVQDVFGFPQTVYVTPEPGLAIPPGDSPSSSPNQQVLESPYVELVANLSNADLAAFPADAGALLTLATRPQAGLNYLIYSAAEGEEYADNGSGEWCPTAVVTEAAGFLDTDFTFSGGHDLDDVVVGSWALWGSEIVRVDALDATAGTLSLGRACADTVPSLHAAEARIYFCGDWVATDRREYSAGEDVRAKLLTRTSTSLQSLIVAPEHSLTMAQRHFRPYPPGRVRINGEAYPESIEGDVTVAWAHRDRLLQADKLFESELTDIGPEAGTEYGVRIYDGSSALRFSTDVGDGPVTATSDLLAGATALRVEVFSLRDGLESLQRYVHTLAYEGAGVTGAPVLLSVTTTTIATNVTTHPVQMPATVAPGDLLIISIAVDGNPTITTPAGWSAHSAIVVTTDRARHAQFLKVAGGTEDGTTVNITTSVAEQSIAHVHRIEAGTFGTLRAGRLYDSRFAAAQNGATPLTKLFPSRGFVPHLVLAWGFVERNDSTGGPTVSTWPLTQEQHAQNSGAADGVFHAVCSQPILSEYIDVASYQLSSPPAASWGAKMLAIPPSGAAVQPELLFTRPIFSGNNTFTTLTVDINNDTVNAPIASGDLLLLFISLAQPTTTLGTLTGWTLLNRTSRHAWYYKIAGASEPASQAVSSSVGTQFYSTLYVIAAGSFDPAVAPQIAVATGTSSAPAPPALSPGWASGRHMVFASESHAMTTTANPITQYALDAQPIRHLLSTFITSQTANGVGNGVSSGIAVGTSVTPGTFTLGASAAWTAATVMVKAPA